MQVQINTDKNIEGSAKLTEEIETLLAESLKRFGNWITRVEVQLSDESSAAKSSDDDKRCLMEARPAGQKPISVSHHGKTVDQALNGCVKKLVKVLGDTKDRLDGSKGSTSFAGEQTI